MQDEGRAEVFGSYEQRDGSTPSQCSQGDNSFGNDGSYLQRQCTWFMSSGNNLIPHCGIGLLDFTDQCDLDSEVANGNQNSLGI